TLSCECGGEMRRVPEVIDCWYDSGAMPFAQWHYPFENQQEFQGSHPADFISEGLDQTRGWFYTLLAEAVMLFDEPAYRNVVVPSLVVDEQGRKMAKSRGNVVDPEELIKRTSADAVRWWFYTTVTVGLEYRISQARVQEGAVRFLNLLWNTQSFFVTYANLAQWSPGQSDPAAPATVLERWIRARLEETVGHVVAALDQYDANSACRAIATLVDDTSTWYLRRSRSRFRGTPQEVAAACATLHLVLSRLALLIAPFTPFIAEAIYRELTPGAGTAGSVHLARYPEPDRAAPDIDLIGQMRVVRRLAEEGRKEREGHGVPLRQPLALAEVRGVELGDELAQVLAQELNVEEVRCAASAIGPAPSVALDFTLTPELRRRGWLRSFGHQLQELRRRSGLSPGDPIEVRHFSESEQAAEALEAGRNQIQDLCFARSLLRVGSREELDGGFSPWTELKLAPDPIWVAIRRIPPEAQ
ncbi:MAG: class I tRNA ligase family protein, partial [Candidatus Dormibacteria bacterium]